MNQIAPNIHELSYPLSVCGAKFGRRVSLLPLKSGGTFVHSSAPFSESDLSAIKELGEPEFLFEPTPIHDTHTKVGCQRLPQTAVVAPTSLHKRSGRTEVFTPESKQDELAEHGITLHRLDGLSFGEEWALYYRPAKALIVADLFFHFPEEVSGWTKQFLKLSTGKPVGISMSRLFRFLIRDRKAFQTSLEPILEQDIQHLIPGHGSPAETSSKDLEAVLRDHRFF